MLEPITAGNTEENTMLPTRRLKILVVDDEPDIADIAGKLLACHGIDALVAYSAHEALELLKSQANIDAIFSDVMMPFMTGLELAEEVVKTYPSIRIVLTSGFTALHYWNQQNRHFPFITKPYSIDAVIHLLKR